MLKIHNARTYVIHFQYWQWISKHFSLYLILNANIDRWLDDKIIVDYVFLNPHTRVHNTHAHTHTHIYIYIYIYIYESLRLLIVAEVKLLYCYVSTKVIRSVYNGTIVLQTFFYKTNVCCNSKPSVSDLWLDLCNKNH